ncbi:MAG: proline--tRNA ligase [Chlamydiales bacterium]|nr:proline--tRNA ligase [Chlamydiales bacterium]
MRTSHLFFRTFKEPPAETDIISHQLLERGGYIRRLSKGIYSYTPLMMRVLKKILTIVRDELDKAGAQEVSLPFLHPAHYWKESGRWDDFKSEKLLYTLEDREGHPYCLAPTHEEVVVALVANWATSYKQLPFNLYQIGNKFRDEIRPRFGLMRGKEFLMKDGYSFCKNPEEMDQQYEAMSIAYSNIFKRLGLKFVIVEAHGGKIGRGKSEEFQVVADIGEDAVMVCESYAANVEATKSIPPSYSYEKSLKPQQRVATPGTKTIEDLAIFLKVDHQQILKTLVYKLIYSDREEYVAIGIRGDRQINSLKVGEKFGSVETLLATEEEVNRVTGASLGFIGPLDSKLPFYADNSARPMTNFVCAHNEDGVHYIHVNWERDLALPTFEDFLLAEEGDSCPHIPGGVYHMQRGIEVGHIFNIGTKYTEKLGGFFQDENGEMKPIWMGTYGIGIGRTAAACIEQSHDEKGIIWPKVIAPFRILITAAATNEPTLIEAAEKIYQTLAPFEPLLDDRDERLGFKLKDSDLMGIPYKLIVGKSFTKEGKVEIESRLGEKHLVAPDAVKEWAFEHLDF